MKGRRAEVTHFSSWYLGRLHHQLTSDDVASPNQPGASAIIPIRIYNKMEYRVKCQTAHPLYLVLFMAIDRSHCFMVP